MERLGTKRQCSPQQNCSQPSSSLPRYDSQKGSIEALVDTKIRCHLRAMWAKPNQLTTAGTARPLRVAYLIDTDDCPDQLLDRIFDEAYGRWGGRRTLIIPAK